MVISNFPVHESLPTGGYEDQLFLDLPPESPHCPVCQDSLMHDDLLGGVFNSI